MAPLEPEHRVHGFWRGSIYVVGLVILVAAGLGWYGLRSSRSAAIDEARQARQEEAARGPLVSVIAVQAGPSTRQVTLLGDAHPFQAATLYAKVSGYLEKINVDKGDRVKAGEIVAQIASPEIGQQYAGAVADLENKRRIRQRAVALARNGNVAQQTVENTSRDVTVAEANARELAAMKSYQLVRAPFDGVVIERFADPGALVQNAQSSQQSALALVSIADDSRLRVYVHVTQADAPFVKVGEKAVVADAANPKLTVEAKVARMAGALDPETRTLLTEVDIEKKGQVYTPLPGSSVYVTLDIPVQSLPEIPATALVLHGDKTNVAAIGPDNHIHLIPVKVVQTDGKTAQIAGDVRPGLKIGVNLPATVGDGDLVRPAEAATAAK